MRRFLSFLFAFLMTFCCIRTPIYAEAISNLYAVPSTTATALYDVYGDAKMLELNEEIIQSVFDICPNVIDFMVLEIETYNRGEAYFFVKAPIACDWYDWFLIEPEGKIVANLQHEEINDEWFQVEADFWAGYEKGIYYLIWTE
jgi:hypothetical protein